MRLNESQNREDVLRQHFVARKALSMNWNKEGQSTLSRQSCTFDCKKLVSKQSSLLDSCLFAGTLPAEWGRPQSFPRLELLSVSLTRISGDASVQEASNSGMHA